MPQLDKLTTRSVVLGLLKAYSEPSEESEKEIEAILPLLQYSASSEVRDQAAHVTRLWLGLQGRCGHCHPRLVHYRLHHLDNELEKLNQMTTPKKGKRNAKV